MCQKNTFKTHVDLLLIGEEREKQNVLIKDFDIFMIYHILHCPRKHFDGYCLKAFSTAIILKRY